MVKTKQIVIFLFFMRKLLSSPLWPCFCILYFLLTQVKLKCLVGKQILLTDTIRQQGRTALRMCVFISLFKYFLAWTLILTLKFRCSYHDNTWTTPYTHKQDFKKWHWELGGDVLEYHYHEFIAKLVPGHLIFKFFLLLFNLGWSRSCTAWPWYASTVEEISSNNKLLANLVITL